MDNYVTKILLLFVLFLGFGAANTFAQQNGSSDFEALQEELKKDYFSVGALLQTVAEYQQERIDGNNGFSVGNARFQVYGELDDTFGYQLQASMLNSPVILDANLYYKLTPNFTAKAGLFKSPFSAEFLTGAAATDFVNRSTVVGQLAPNRQIGFQLGGALAEGNFRYSAGMFNGNGSRFNENIDDQFLYVARMESHLNIGDHAESQLIVGLNAAYEDKRGTLPNNIRSQFQGEQVLAGADARLTLGDLMLSGEVIYSRLSNTSREANPFGYHATAGYFVTPKTQLLLRWDWFDADNLGTNSETAIAGINFFSTSYSEIQLNYVVPTNQDIEFSKLLLKLQLNI